jgi:hypothetical protein
LTIGSSHQVIQVGFQLLRKSVLVAKDLKAGKVGCGLPVKPIDIAKVRAAELLGFTPFKGLDERFQPFPSGLSSVDETMDCFWHNI